MCSKTLLAYQVIDALKKGTDSVMVITMTLG